MNATARRRAGALDPTNREAAEGLARQAGVSLPEWIEALGEADPGGRDVGRETLGRLTAPPHPADEIRDMSSVLERLSERLEAAETRQALAVSGIDRLVREALSRLEGGEREQTAVAARFEGAVQEVSEEQARLAERLARIEAEARGPRSAEALRALEAALGKVAAHLYRGETRTEALIETVRARVERLEANQSEPEALASAVAAIRGFESRLDGLAGAISGQAEAVRAADQRASHALERMGREVVEVSQALIRKVQAAESRGAEAIEQVGGEVARIASAMEARLGRADSVQAQALERLGAEIERIAERLAERIAHSDNRSAAAIDEVGDQVARITERLGQRQERASDDLAERIRQSEERTARLLQEARATIDELAVGARSPAEPAAEIQAETPAPEPEDSSPPPAETAEIEGLVGDDPFEVFRSDRLAPDLSLLDRLQTWEEECGPLAPKPRPEEPSSVGQAADEPAAADWPFAVDVGAETGAPLYRPPQQFSDPQPAAEPFGRSARAGLLSRQSPAGEWVAPEPAASARVTDRADTPLFTPRKTRPFDTGRRRGRGGKTAALGMGMAAAFGLALGGLVVAQNDPHGAFAGGLADLLRAGPRPAPTGGIAGGAGGPEAAIALAPASSFGAVDSQAASLYAAAAARIGQGDDGAVADLRHAAEMGYAPAQFYLARLYETGAAGLAKDAAAARQWTQRAAEAGDARAMHNLALYEFQGEGGPRDTASAAAWFRRAAQLGLPDSQYNLGRLYEEGAGAPQNLAEAYKWYLIAGRSGDPLSKAAAARVKTELTPDARAVAERAALAFRAQGPLDSSGAAATSPTMAAAAAVASAQKALLALGYYQGPTDGSATPAFGLALSAYQHDQGLPETGRPDATTMGKLANLGR